MLILCRILLLLLCSGANFFGLTASTATVEVDVPVHVGGTNISAGTYRLVWTNGLHETDVLVSVDGRHLPLRATVEPDPKPGKDRAILRKDGAGYVLVGFWVKGQLFTVHERF